MKEIEKGMSVSYAIKSERMYKSYIACIASLPNLGRYIHMVLVDITHIHSVEHFGCVLQFSDSCREARDDVLLMYLICLIWTHFLDIYYSNNSCTIRQIVSFNNI